MWVVNFTQFENCKHAYHELTCTTKSSVRVLFVNIIISHFNHFYELAIRSRPVRYAYRDLPTSSPPTHHAINISQRHCKMGELYNLNAANFSGRKFVSPFWGWGGGEVMGGGGESP